VRPAKSSSRASTPRVCSGSITASHHSWRAQFSAPASWSGASGDAAARVGPHQQRVGPEGAAAQRVVGSAMRLADDDGELGHVGIGRRVEQLGAVAAHAALRRLAAVGETGGIDQEHERDVALAAQLGEVRALGRGLRGERTAAGDDADLEALDAGEGAPQGLAVQRLELLEAAAVDQAREQFAGIGRGFAVQAH